MTYAITTVDNPYDPLDDFVQWFLFDEEMGYHTCAWLARLVNITEQMSEDEVDAAIRSAIDKIILNDPANVYKRIEREDDNTNIVETLT